MHIRPAITLLFLFPAAGFAQGDDSCASAQTISGTGMFTFDNSAATTDGTAHELCLSAGQDQVELDVWFAWTPPTASRFEISTCSQTTVDSRIAVYEGTCTSLPVGCNDDACGLQSLVQVVAGPTETILIRIGVYPNGAGGTGTFAITDIGLPQILGSMVYPGNGRTYHILEATTWMVAQGSAQELGGDLVTVNDQAENDWINAMFHQFGGQNRSLWTGLNDFVVEGTFEWVSGEPVAYTNWSTGEPNGGAGPEDFAHFRSDWGNGSWNDLVNDPSNGFYSTVHGIVEVGALGTNYCTSATNSTGAAATIFANGSASVAANDLQLVAGPAPTGEPGIFYYGPDELPGLPFGDGFRCVGGPAGTIERLFPFAFASPAGEMVYDVDNTLPAHAAQLGVAGTTWKFQAWFRDPAGGPSGFNLSDGLSVTLVP